MQTLTLLYENEFPGLKALRMHLQKRLGGVHLSYCSKSMADHHIKVVNEASGKSVEFYFRKLVPPGMGRINNRDGD